MRLTVLTLAALAGVLALTGCEKHLKAPGDTEVCYFIGHPTGSDGKSTVKFNVLARHVPDPEHCAGELYKARMSMAATNTAGDMTEGVWQGAFLFVGNSTVDEALSYEGARFPFLVRVGDQFVPANQVQQADDTPDTKPQTVEVPKDLPKKNDQGIVVTPAPDDAQKAAPPAVKKP